MNNTQPSSHNEELDLFVLASIIWAKKTLLIKAVAIAVVCAILYLQVATHTYTITLKVTPVASSSGPMNGSLGQLASMAGANLDIGGENNSFELYLEGLHSVETGKTLTENKKLLIRIFPRYWNKDQNEWSEPKGLFRSIKNVIKALLGRPYQPWEKPAGGELQVFLEKNIMISKNTENSIVALSVNFTDVEFGKKLLSTLHAIVDENLRVKSLERSKKQIAYLTLKLQGTQIAEHRQILAASLLKQENIGMTASSGLPFAAEPFGKPYSSVKPTTPNLILVLLLAVFFGLFICIVWILIVNQMKNSDTDFNKSI